MTARTAVAAADWPKRETCSHRRCTLPVVNVRLLPKLEPVALDPEPASWTDGARVRLSTHQPDRDQPPLAKLVTASGGFGMKLYKKHDLTCMGQQRRAKTKAGSS